MSGSAPLFFFFYIAAIFPGEWLISGLQPVSTASNPTQRALSTDKGGLSTHGGAGGGGGGREDSD